jgi:hypothetical protein
VISCAGSRSALHQMDTDEEYVRPPRDCHGCDMVSSNLVMFLPLLRLQCFMTDGLETAARLLLAHSDSTLTLNKL